VSASGQAERSAIDPLIQHTHMARRRFRRKDLKRPDEFVSRGRAYIEWAQANVRTLSWGVGGAALLALVAAGYFSLRSARVRQANDDLDRAIVEFHAGHYSQAAAQFADVASRWQLTPVGRVADLYAANAQLKAANFEGAATALQAAIGNRDWPPYLQQAALLDLAFALEQKGDAQTAAARYAEARAIEGPYTAMALLGEARCRAQAGEKDKARELYERFSREFPQAPEVDLVGAKIAQLKS
jgi:outer membrane protein assembly factor BamD (BamD/ComL family)